MIAQNNRFQLTCLNN